MQIQEELTFKYGIKLKFLNPLPIRTQHRFSKFNL